MLVKEIKPIGKVGKNLLENQDAEKIIELIIEKPLQKACKMCKEKKIETVMSSCNKKNIVKETRVNLDKVRAKIEQKKVQTFLDLGKGYGWIMLNFNTLSTQNRKILFKLEKEMGQDTIVLAKSNYIEVMNSIRRFLKLKELTENFEDEFSKEFTEKQVIIMYNNKYPRRSVFIRMPIDETTTIEDVEQYFKKIIEKLENQ